MAEQLDYVARVQQAYDAAVAEHSAAMLHYALNLGNDTQASLANYDALVRAQNSMWMAAKRLAAYL